MSDLYLPKSYSHQKNSKMDDIEAQMATHDIYHQLDQAKKAEHKKKIKISACSAIIRGHLGFLKESGNFEFVEEFYRAAKRMDDMPKEQGTMIIQAWLKDFIKRTQ